MKRTPAEWAEIQRSHIEREATKRKPRGKRGELPPEERPKRCGLTFKLTTNVAPDAPAVTIKAPAPTGVPIQFRGPVLPHHHAALTEIYQLTDQAIFITWAAVRLQIRKVAGRALGIRQTP